MTRNQFPPRLSVFGLIAIAVIILANFSNPPNGRTGAPGDNGTCTGCHSGNNPNGFDGFIVIDNFPTLITPNNTYNLTAKVTNPNGQAIRGGFQAVVLNETAANTNTGDLMVSGTNPTTTLSGGREYVEHDPGLFFPPNNEITWNFTWTAPSGSNGDIIKIYAAGNIANGGGSSGDFIVTTVASGTMDDGGGLPLEANAAATDETAAGANDGTATANPSGGAPDYTFLWSTNEITQTITGLSPGTYSVVVSDNNGNTAADSVIVNPGDCALTLLLTAIDPSCFASCDGSIQSSTNGGSTSICI